MAEERIRESRRVLRRGDGRQDDVDALAVGLLERELCRFDAVRDSEAVEHLGGEQVVRRQPAKVRRVVARDERLDELEDLLDRHVLYRHETIPDERSVGRVDDVHAVGEVVQAHGVEVELLRVGRIARERGPCARFAARARR